MTALSVMQTIIDNYMVQDVFARMDILIMALKKNAYLVITRGIYFYEILNLIT